jgi:hypothetical protein
MEVDDADIEGSLEAEEGSDMSEDGKDGKDLAVNATAQLAGEGQEEVVTGEGLGSKAMKQRDSGSTGPSDAPGTRKGTEKDSSPSERDKEAQRENGISVDSKREDMELDTTLEENVEELNPNEESLDVVKGRQQERAEEEIEYEEEEQEVEGEYDEEEQEDEEEPPEEAEESNANIMEEIWLSVMKPGIPNSRVQFFFNIIFLLLFGVLGWLFVISGFNIHVVVLIGAALGLFASTQWFIMEAASITAEGGGEETQEGEATDVEVKKTK